MLAIQGALGASTIVSGLMSVVSLLTGASGFTVAMAGLQAAALAATGFIAYEVTRMIMETKVFGVSLDDIAQGWLDRQKQSWEDFKKIFSIASNWIQDKFGMRSDENKAAAELEEKGINNSAAKMITESLQDAMAGKGNDISGLGQVAANPEQFAKILKISTAEVMALVEKERARYKSSKPISVSQQDAGVNAPSFAVPVSQVATTTTAVPIPGSKPVNQVTPKTSKSAGGATYVAGDVYLDSRAVGTILLRDAGTSQ